VSDREVEGVAGLLSVDESTSKQIIEDIRTVITESLYYNFTESQLAKFLGDLPSEVIKTVTTIVVHYLPEWKTKVISEQVSLPKLQSIDWRMDIKGGSDQINRMNVPTVIVDMKVDGVQKNIADPPSTRSIVFELSKDDLEIVLGGLDQIKKQLDKIG